MQANVEVDKLYSAMGKILSIIEKKKSRPILTYTLFQAKDNQIQLLATNLEVSAKIIIKANVEKEGMFCVNAKNIFDILKELPEDIIDLSMNDEKNILNLNCKEIHYSLLVYSSDDFPNIVFENKHNEFFIGSEQIAEIINKTSHAISNDETRNFLNGIFLQETDSKLRAVATDGHRLALLETDLSQDNISPLINGIIVPKKGIFELKKIAESYPAKQIQVSLDDSFMHINAENEYYLSIRLIAREYLKYQAGIPDKTTYSMLTDRNSFLNAIRRIKIMSSEKSNSVKLLLKENEMIVMANHPSFGDASEKISIQYSGKELTIKFNAKYLMDILTTLDESEEKVCLELNNEFKQVLFKSPTQPDFLSVIMPLTSR